MTTATKLTPDDMRADYDWREAFEYGTKVEPVEGWEGSLDAVRLDDVEEVIAASVGENDGADWVCVVRLRDRRFAFLSAGCDYTGWDCQAGGRVWVHGDLDALVQFGCTREARERMGLA